jgi:hypothetical protein
MTIALMSRGYLSRKGDVVIVQVGDGPDIIDQRLVRPDISGAGVTGVAPPPTISGAAVPGPELSTVSQETPPELGAPSISGGSKPEIG